MTASTLTSEVALVDHHCHGVVPTDLDRAGMESLLSEGGAQGAGLSNFDTPVGLAVRRWCAPLLDLPRHASAEDYVDRRNALGAEEVNRRLLRATGTARYLMDTGFRSGTIMTPPELAAVAGARADEVVRLEVLAEQVAAGGVDAAGFVAAFDAALARATASAVGLKSIVAYRGGFDFDPEPPSERDVTAAAGEWLRHGEQTGNWRLVDQVLLRHVIWRGVQRRLPLQFHVGYGDPDIVLYRTDPSRLTHFLHATAGSGTSIMLLHCYPFHRHAAYLAAILPHVYFDVGLTIPYVGARATAVLAEALELAPFTKLLYSSDAFGLPELYLTGSVLYREALGAVLEGWLADDVLSAADAERIVRLISSENANRVYGLDAG